MQDKCYLNDPQNWLNKQVHVDGWNKGAVFRLVSTNGRLHKLVTPKTGRIYVTSNRLYHINSRADNLRKQQGVSDD